MKTLQGNKTRIIFSILPLILLSGMVYYIMNAGTFIDRRGSLPDLAVEKIEFKEEEVKKIIVYARNIGQETITIAQADIDDRPMHAVAIPNIIDRLGSSKLIIYYPWIENVPYEVGITLSDGTRFAFDVDAAVPTPEASYEELLYFAIIGTYVGIIPVMLGFLWLPFMRRVDTKWYLFFLTLTAGLLAFLVIDTMLESLELTSTFSIVNGEILIAVITISTFLLLMLKEDKTKSALYLSYMIAVGIGLHNLGEGLAIVAPMTRSKVKIAHLAILGIIAGAPTIAGAWIGSFVNTPLASIMFLSIGVERYFKLYTLYLIG